MGVLVMKKFMLSLVMLVAAAKGMACSMEVDQNYTKNLLVAHALSYNEHFVGSVSGITTTDYDLSFSGGSGGGSCPDYLITSARVSYSHSPSLIKHCTYSVTVTQTTYMGNGIPHGPLDDVSFSAPAAACSTSISAIRVPRRVPLRFKPRVRFP